ncbi:hypothetical protein GH714_012636 [Hevea brasiliensis]|uniref:Uncharacterized protein n=1 Tax=Hevea brasiliensis TaxID=3981 RepID=A0A6A6MMT6_HEVBR|nr:hypothetical protein GH714_012636 [Hevea brasiliensis]
MVARFPKQDDSNDTFTSMVNNGDGLSSKGAEVSEDEENELMTAKKALSEAQATQEAMEKERDQLLEELARSEAKQQEHVATILHDKELAIAELEATKSLFHRKLQETALEKLVWNLSWSLQNKMLLNLQYKLKAFQIEEQIRNATEGTILSVVEQSKDAIQRALDMAENAGDYAKKAVAIFTDGFNPVDEIASIKSENISLRGVVNDLESQLLIKRSEVDKLKIELDHVHAKANASELRAHDAEKALLEFQESNRKMNLVELESIKAAIDAAKETACSRENAYMRRCESLQRSLRASEVALKAWRQRAEMAESLFLKDEKDEDAIFIVNGGRIDLMTDDDSQNGNF